MTNVINFIVAAVLSGTPLLFATTGEILTQRSGNLNLGVEGMMWLGAFAGFYTAYKTENPVLAVLAAFGLAAFGALIYAFLTVTMKANQNVTGLTLTTFGIGLSLVMGYAMIDSAGGAPKVSSELRASLAPADIPFLSDIPYVGKLLFQYNPLVYLGIAVAALSAVYLYRTRTGLNVRAVGENPSSADAAGINVTAAKYINILIGGGICGIGGAYMSLVTANGSWQPAGIVNGNGWIAVALVIFVSWNPAKAILGSFIFGAFNSLTNYIPASVVEIPKAFYQMLPFVLTTVVLIITSIRKSRENSQPAGCGINYFREER
ncbi:MAG TPA: ABC transporter permease [Clostridiales bacterium]|nr:MAG: Branched-chain amino acid transport system / permease component [Firmicutes bacterium ADurb.Bin262]HOU10704.1 ABC transporter permease [Clostridiales bacterium]HQH62724.1 ABC transporter permease [Clostridiales bacterium]